MKANQKMILIAAAAAGAGAIAGILFAPHKGKKTRKLMQLEGQLASEKLCSKISKGLSMLKELKEEMSPMRNGNAEKEKVV